MGSNYFSLPETGRNILYGRVPPRDLEFDDDFKEIKYYYENREVIETESQGTYTDKSADIKAKEYGWNHSISEVLNALITHGMQIEFFNEYMYSPYPCFNNVVQNKDGGWWIQGLEDKIPMVYSVKAVNQ